MVAVSVYYAIKTLHPDWEIMSFIVTSREGNLTNIDGVPVVTLQEFDRIDVQVLIAVPENFHKEIADSLEEKGLQDYVCIDSEKKRNGCVSFMKKQDRFRF